MWMHRSSAPSGPLPKRKRKIELTIICIQKAPLGKGKEAEKEKKKEEEEEEEEETEEKKKGKKEKRNYDFFLTAISRFYGRTSSLIRLFDTRGYLRCKSKFFQATTERQQTTS